MAHVKEKKIITVNVTITIFLLFHVIFLWKQKHLCKSEQKYEIAFRQLWPSFTWPTLKGQGDSSRKVEALGTAD